MNKSMKRWSIFSLAVCFSLAMTSCGNDSKDGSSNVSVYESPAQYEYEVSNLNIAVGVRDYCFIGYVTSDGVTDYNSGEEFPMTNFQVQILEPVKGNLKDEISLVKWGGLLKDQNVIQITEDDVMLEKGKYYAFTCSARDDGQIDCSGINSSVELESGINADNLDQSKIVSEFEDAYANEVIPDNYIDDGYKSVYEE